MEVIIWRVFSFAPECEDQSQDGYPEAWAGSRREALEVARSWVRAGCEAAREECERYGLEYVAKPVEIKLERVTLAACSPRALVLACLNGAGYVSARETYVVHLDERGCQVGAPERAVRDD